MNPSKKENTFRSPEMKVVSGEDEIEAIIGRPYKKPQLRKPEFEDNSEQNLSYGSLGSWLDRLMKKGG